MAAESSSRDLLRRFAGISTTSGYHPPEAAAELILGLSWGGCFTSNPREKSNSLIRSASISSLPYLISSIVKGDDDEKKDSASVRAGTAPQLKRTCSMPVPGAEDYRKRKVLQTLKRLEAKRKRHEKRISGDGGGLPPLSVGSGGCNSSSSGGPMQVFESTSSKKLGRRASGTSELDMPCVSTTGSIPNGKRIEGFLYKYCKGEEVRIVCVCHGNFLTPAEFVGHAGGGDVDHPMRHIVVNAPPSPFL